MTRPTRISILLNSVSHGAQHFSLTPRRYAFELGQNYEGTSLTVEPVYGFLARIKMWISLLWGERKPVYVSARIASDAPLNRRFARRRRKWGNGQKIDWFGYMILRQQGHIRWQQWIYKYTLIGRVRRCFRPSFWRAIAGHICAVFSSADIMLATCPAPLSPD